MKKGYIKASILFQGGEDEIFDMDYFLDKHVSLMNKALENSIKHFTIEKGISGGAPGSMAPYIAIVEIYFSGMEMLNNTLPLLINDVVSDIKNFTSGRPLIQISEIRYNA